MRIRYSKTPTKDKDCIVIYSTDNRKFWLGKLVYKEHYVGSLIMKEENFMYNTEFYIFQNQQYEFVNIFYISRKDFKFLEKVIKTWDEVKKLLVYLEEEKL